MCTKSFVSWGFAPDPTEGAYRTSQTPLAVFRALLLKGEEEREDRKGRRGEGR